MPFKQFYQSIIPWFIIWFGHANSSHAKHIENHQLCIYSFFSLSLSLFILLDTLKICTKMSLFTLVYCFFVGCYLKTLFSLSFVFFLNCCVPTFFTLYMARHQIRFSAVETAYSSIGALKLESWLHENFSFLHTNKADQSCFCSFKPHNEMVESIPSLSKSLSLDRCACICYRLFHLFHSGRNSIGMLLISFLKRFRSKMSSFHFYWSQASRKTIWHLTFSEISFFSRTNVVDWILFFCDIENFQRSFHWFHTL